MKTNVFILSWLLIAMPGALMAQPQFFSYTTNANNTLVVEGYSGSAGPVTIPTNVNGLAVVGIGTDSFVFQTNLTDVTVPGSVTNVESDAFYGAVALTNVILGEGIVNIDDNTFELCVRLARVSLPSSITNIGDYAFSGCGNLTSFIIPSNVTCLGVEVFLGSGLTNLQIPMSVSLIKDSAFSYCSNLACVTFGNGVTSIDYHAFAYCASLTSIVVPASVTNVAAQAFYACSKLTSVLLLGNAPVTSNSPGGPAFGSDPNLTVYHLSSTTGWSNTFGGVPTAVWNPVLQTHDGHFGLKGNQFGFNITGATNLPVAIMACTNISNHVWSSVANVILTNGTYYFSDALQTNTTRFYGLGFP